LNAVPTPKFFEDSNAFRTWLLKHSETESELLVGFYKVSSDRPSMTWPESVDEALCFGWIDGVRKRIDEHAYQIRFTPRKPTSIWSAVNIKKMEALKQAGRLMRAGEEAFYRRTEKKSVIYAYEQPAVAELSDEQVREFKKNPAAWRYFESCPASYRKVLLHWVSSAKKAQTRDSRLVSLIGACAEGRRLR
jgi:uncharacterized protein YdeI (YjbR/CyaY-like superfamily)